MLNVYFQINHPSQVPLAEAYIKINSGAHALGGNTKERTLARLQADANVILNYDEYHYEENDDGPWFVIPDGSNAIPATDDEKDEKYPYEIYDLRSET